MRFLLPIEEHEFAEKVHWLSHPCLKSNINRGTLRLRFCTLRRLHKYAERHLTKLGLLQLTGKTTGTMENNLLLGLYRKRN